MKIASQKYGPRDFSKRLIHKMLITLCEQGFSPTMADIVADESGKAKEIVNICNGLRCSKSCRPPGIDWRDFNRKRDLARDRENGVWHNYDGLGYL